MSYRRRKKSILDIKPPHEFNFTLRCKSCGKTKGFDNKEELENELTDCQRLGHLVYYTINEQKLLEKFKRGEL